ncbi:CoA-binding protein [Anatilimnocola sp. NA78]|uniref:CoA-binding protein n=1 Tax=Anatilimnocola sp. NA78 TaxID=3415683 RepID=UPI003CE4D75C
MPTVAILGASTDRTKFGNKSVRAHQAKGYTVYPINPKADEIEGLKAYSSLAEVPAGTINRVSVYLPPQVGIKVLPEIAARGCDELWLNPGTESDELIAAAESLGLNVIQACSIVDVGMSPRELP